MRVAAKDRIYAVFSENTRPFFLRRADMLFVFAAPMHHAHDQVCALLPHGRHILFDLLFGKLPHAPFLFGLAVKGIGIGQDPHLHAPDIHNELTVVILFPRIRAGVGDAAVVQHPQRALNAAQTEIIGVVVRSGQHVKARFLQRIGIFVRRVEVRKTSIALLRPGKGCLQIAHS